jgi:hypothetical protein
MSKRGGKSGRPTIKVSSETREKLKELKKRLSDAKNMDDVINHLMNPPGPEDHDSASDPEGAESPGQKKKRKINVQEPLYDLEALCERPGMLEYYTGLDRSQFDMLLERLSKVRNGLLLFFLFFSSL